MSTFICDASHSTTGRSIGMNLVAIQDPTYSYFRKFVFEEHDMYVSAPSVWFKVQTILPILERLRDTEQTSHEHCSVVDQQHSCVG